MRTVLKRALLFAATVPALPFILLARAGILFGSEGLFAASAQALSLIPGKTGSYLRVAYYRLTLGRISPDAVIGFGTFFSKRSAEIGKNVYIGAYCVIGSVTIGDASQIATGVSITSGRHQHGAAVGGARDPAEGHYARVAVGARTWIGERAVVMADVGSDCIVGAGSVVTRPVLDGTAVAGSPARPLMKEGKVPAGGTAV